MGVLTMDFKKYEKPLVSVIYLDSQDVLSSSGGSSDDNIFGEELPDTPFN